MPYRIKLSLCLGEQAVPGAVSKDGGDILGLGIRTQESDKERSLRTRNFVNGALFRKLLRSCVDLTAAPEVINGCESKAFYHHFTLSEVTYACQLAA